MTTLKLTIIGDGNVGKTSILTAFIKNTFYEQIEPTIFDNFEHSIDIFGEHYNLMLFDTAGQEDYDKIRSLSYPNTDVFLLCYAIDDLNSFDNIKNIWMKDIEKYTSTVPIILIGTKMDLRSSSLNETKYITTLQGLTLAKSIGAHTAIECSAKDSLNIQQIFEEAVRARVKESQKTEEAIVENGESCKYCKCSQNCNLM